MSVSSSKKARASQGNKSDKYAQQAKRGKNSGRTAGQFSPPREEYKTSFQPVKAKNFMQQTFLDSMKLNTVLFVKGSAGTGKTFLAAGYAAEQLFFRHVDQIIVSRPNVEAGPSMGFLPGELEDKFAPYLEPFKDAFQRFLGKGAYEMFLKSERILPVPIGFMRGRTFDNSIILIDEAQNIEPALMKMILSRIGENSTIIFTGDTSQKDINGNSGLDEAIRIVGPLPDVDVLEFRSEDIVRSKMCKSIIMAYENS